MAKKHPWKVESLQSSQAKLTPKQRDEISEKKRNGENTRDLAKEYGVSNSTIRKV